MSNSKSSISATDNRLITALLVCLILAILPFGVLSFYSFPVVDDFSFVDSVRSHGFWAAQKDWYLTWTGRYFSTFILSINPLLIDSILLYQFINFLIIVGSVHSLYFLIKKVSGPYSNKMSMAIIALSVCLAYLAHLPDLTQAFYWLPGSITYQLSLISATYLTAILLPESHAVSKIHSYRRLVVMMILTLIGCASNEVMMLLTNLIVLIALVYSLITKRPVFKLVVLQSWACLTGLLVIFAPGNKVRGGGQLSQLDWTIFSKAIVNSVDAGEAFLHNYWLIPILPLLVVGIMLGKPNRNTRTSTNVAVLSGIVLFALGAAFLTFLTSFLSVGMPPPARTQNVCFWFVLLGSILLGTQLGATGIVPRPKTFLRYAISGIAAGLILFFPHKTGFEKSLQDLTSGTAQAYSRQQTERAARLANASNTEKVIIPALSAFPNAVYLNDLSEKSSDWWNILTARHYQVKAIEVDFSNLKSELSFTTDFANPSEYAINIHSENLQTDSSSTPHSRYVLRKPNHIYGPGISLPFQEIWHPIKHKLAYIKATANAKVTEQGKSVHIAIILNSKGNQLLLWQSQLWDADATSTPEGFIQNEFFIPIDAINQRVIEKVLVYVWNPEEAEVVLEELTVELF